jgi:hypothetical protein
MATMLLLLLDGGGIPVVVSVKMGEHGERSTSRLFSRMKG